MDSFNELGIDELFIEKLKKRYITKPTNVQSLVIPNLLEGKDIVFRSETGTGKTFAYLLPILQKILPEGSNDTEAGVNKGSPEFSVLICAPTLELCSQIKAEIEFLTTMPSLLLIGSVLIDKQINTLRKIRPNIIVGNPQRLLVLAKMGKLKFNNLRFLVLDEADRLTAVECLEETTELLSLIKRGVKQSLCVAACSATVSTKTITKLGPLFENAQIAESDDHEILQNRIEHWAIYSEKRKKVQALRSLLSAIKGKKSHIKVLVFTSRGDDAEKILSQLQYHGVSVSGLFGKANKKPLTGAQRKEAIERFRDGKADVLISTDLAARGLDIPGITHVIALDVPEDGDVYIHRCGRTGRAGKRGKMITVGDETQLRLLAALEKRLKIIIYPKELYGGKILNPQEEELQIAICRLHIGDCNLQ